VSQAAVGRAAAAADDLQLLLCAVGAVQQLLDELLQSHLGVGLTRRRLLQELVDLGHLPAGGGGGGHLVVVVVVDNCVLLWGAEVMLL